MYVAVYYDEDLGGARSAADSIVLLVWLAAYGVG